MVELVGGGSDPAACAAGLFLKILGAVCLGYVYILDIGSIPFQIIRQKFVQHCETQMEAQSCKAS